MKLKLVIAVVPIAIFGLMNQPFVPVPVILTAYSVAYMPSILASGLTYWYYDNTMEAKRTVLTTAAKSVVGWHAALSTTYYGQVNTALIWSSELEEYWNNNENQTCVTILPISVVGPTFLVSVLEFQVLRALLVFYPYDVLALNHDSLAYPLVASVPTVTGILQLITYLNNGTLCNATFLRQLCSKLNIVINIENFKFPSFDSLILIRFLILLVEACIRLKNNWTAITETVMFTVCWLKRKNTVHTSTVQPSSDTLEILQLASYINDYKVGPFLLMTLCFVLIQVLNQALNYILISVDLVFIDFALLGLPIYWVMSSDDICDFIKRKYSQWKYRMGYF